MPDRAVPKTPELANELPTGSDDVVRFATLNPELFEQIHSLIGQRALRQSRSRRTEAYGELLQHRVRALSESIDYGLGDLIFWQEGLKNRRRPDYGEPCIVLDILDEPILTPGYDPGSAFFREPLTLVIGILNDEEPKELLSYYVDGRRFTRTPWEQNPASDESVSLPSSMEN